MKQPVRELTVIRFDSKPPRKGMKRGRLGRRVKASKSRRAPINKVGPKTRTWRNVWNWLRPKMVKAGRKSCEFYFIEHECGGPLDPCHSKKRHEWVGNDIYAVARGCRNVHNILDGMVKYRPFVGLERSPFFSHADMYEAVMRAIEENGGLILPIKRCICTRVCDCENPEPENEEDGVALCSNECPIHNLYQKPHPDCEAGTHWFQVAK